MHEANQLKSFHAVQLRAGETQPVNDTLAVEAVLQIKVNGVPYTTTVRTPGDDALLARGLLFTEEVVTDPRAPLAFHEIADPETQLSACLDVSVPLEFILKDIEGRRSAMASASCGLCGIREPDELILKGTPLRIQDSHAFHIARLPRMLDAMHDAQSAFALSGGCHAAAVFDACGNAICIYEDIGRHNAVDKVIGYLLAAQRLDAVQSLLVSGRLSYEIVFKAFRAGIPVLLAVSAPSSLAVEMAERFGVTLIAFCRDGRATAYAHSERIVP